MLIIYLTTTGAKSGIPRSIPVLCIPDGENLILVGSNWGDAKNPSWANNLRKHPQTLVRKGKMVKGFSARELRGDERAAYWQKAVRFYPPYVSYEQHSNRSLPIFFAGAIDGKASSLFHMIEGNKYESFQNNSSRTGHRVLIFILPGGLWEGAKKSNGCLASR